jgi:hypothetical protein
MKPLCAAIAAIPPLQSEHLDTARDNKGNDIDSMATHGRMAATPAPVAVEFEEGEL